MPKTPASRNASSKSQARKSQPVQTKPKASAAIDRELRLMGKELALKIFDLMIRSRVLEERLIKIYRAGDAYFWIGGPGEEAFGVPLGLLVRKGHGPAFDYLHLHYRGTPTVVAMGMPMIDSIRLIMNRATDPCTGGRNFSNHYCFPEMNVVPVGSPIEVQYGMAVGTAIAQRRRKLKGEPWGVSVVTGGDAGTAEGDFASSLIWASRPGSELPVYLTVQNNKWGISTAYDGQHGEKQIADRGKAFGIKTRVVNGNDPVESYFTIREDLEYIRKTCRPVLAEFMLSRLYGHSSASGANREVLAVCPIEIFEKRLVQSGFLKSGGAKALWEQYENESRVAADTVRSEPVPTSDSIWEHVYRGSAQPDWRRF